MRAKGFASRRQRHGLRARAQHSARSATHIARWYLLPDPPLATEPIPGSLSRRLASPDPSCTKNPGEEMAYGDETYGDKAYGDETLYNVNSFEKPAPMKLEPLPEKTAFEPIEFDGAGDLTIAPGDASAAGLEYMPDSGLPSDWR